MKGELNRAGLLTLGKAGLREEQVIRYKKIMVATEKEGGGEQLLTACQSTEIGHMPRKDNTGIGATS